MRSKPYRVLLVLAALLGVLVSFASWCFLELIHWIQQEVYQRLPSGLGLHPVPWWWPLPVLAVAGVLAAVAIIRLPGHGGHIPYEGIKAGAAQPAELPGILLAALATLGLGLVLGPEAPLIALGSGNHHHPAADLQSRNRHRPADHRRRRRSPTSPSRP